MTSDLTIIILSLGGLILTAAVSLGGLILTQFRTSRRDLDERLAGIDTRLSDATREIRENRERIAQVEVSLTERIAQVEVKLTERIAQVEVSLTELIARVEVKLTERIARVEGNVDILREYIVGKGRKVV